MVQIPWWDGRVQRGWGMTPNREITWYEMLEPEKTEYLQGVGRAAALKSHRLSWVRKEVSNGKSFKVLYYKILFFICKSCIDLRYTM